MTDTYLRSLGFVPTARTPRSSQVAFGQAWRYQFDHLAADGMPLFIEHPLGIEVCRLSTLEAPLTAQDVFASVGLHDRSALQAAMSAFYTAHGGMGAVLAASPASTFQPYRRQL
ncbi:hypothetical protein FNT36_17270 [Hymenobacter setariae]|uniref:Uncharacterized protein n=1 Tax=Hymenobacter setariae TaxID=2594794 RepID=A0A558BSB0_9BACT|nr:hypothetical protein [Hymenobacter setariae]TVT39404.1 hypothetical protein FNT36_17270 [Hymenobacter setariae]